MKYYLWLTKVLFYLCIVIFTILSIMNIYKYRKINTLIFLVPVVFIALAIYFIIKKVNIGKRKFIWVLFLSSFILKSITVLFLKTEPVSDFRLFWYAAKNIANAQTDYLQLEYFKIWGYQMGIVTYYASLVRIFCDNIMIIQIINCIWAALTNVLIYLLAKKVSNEITARTISILYLLYPEPYFLCSTLSNQMLGDLLICAATYILIRKKNIKNALLAGTVAAFGNAVRPTGIVLVITVVFFIFIEFIETNVRSSYHKINFIKALGRTAATISTYFIIGVVLSSLMTFSGLNPNGLKNDFPLYKFVVGLNQVTFGGYSSEDAKLTNISDKKLRNQISLILIFERLKSLHSSFLRFLSVKSKKMWADYDTLSWSFIRPLSGYINIANIKIPFDYFSKIILRFEKSFYILMLVLSALSCILCIKKKQASPAFLMVLLMFLFYFIMLEFVEIQVRYRYFAMIYIFIISSKSFELIEDIKLET